MNLLSRIKKNHEDWKEGKINYLPFPVLGEFTKWFPGLMRGDVTALTGTASSGKTSLLKWLIVYNAVKWAIKHKKNLKIIFFGLEESRILFEYSLLSMCMWDMFGLRYNVRSFECIGEQVNPEHFDKIEQAQRRVNTILTYVDYYDNLYNAYGIYLTVRNYAWEHGQFFLGATRLTNPTMIKSEGWDRYEPSDPEEFVIPIIDNLNVIHPEGKDTEHIAIAKTVEYMRAYSAKHFRHSPVIVHHQDNTSEDSDNRKRKEVLCTLQGLAKNKEVNRLYLNVIGLTNLQRTNTVGEGNTGIQMWKGVHIPSMGNHSRVINIMKNRYGAVDVNDVIFFDGKVGHFETLERTKLTDYYNRVKKYNQ